MCVLVGIHVLACDLKTNFRRPTLNKTQLTELCGLHPMQASPHGWKSQAKVPVETEEAGAAVGEKIFEWKQSKSLRGVYKIHTFKGEPWGTAVNVSADP